MFVRFILWFQTKGCFFVAVLRILDMGLMVGYLLQVCYLFWLDCLLCLGICDLCGLTLFGSVGVC